MSAVDEIMETDQQLELDRHNSDYIEALLRSYEILISSVSELAAEWLEMDEE